MSARQVVIDFVKVFRPDLDETMTSMMAGAYDVPVGTVRDQKYSKRRRKRDTHDNPSRRPSKGKRRKEAVEPCARSLVANAVEGHVGESQAPQRTDRVLDGASRREQLRDLPGGADLDSGLLQVLESRVRSGLRLELQGDVARPEDRHSHVYVRTQSKNR